MDNVTDFPAIVKALDGFSRTLTARVVFDYGVKAADYRPAVAAIRRHAWVMGELGDSYDIKHISVPDWEKRTRAYWAQLKDLVDIWEIGNEVNGEWLGETKDVVAKTTFAARYVKARGAPTALTLVYNEGCYEKPEQEMFAWIAAHCPPAFRRDLDYVLISYYEDGCEWRRPDWTPVFTRLAAEFPRAKVGFGEVGLEKPARDKAAYLRRYYALHPPVPNWVGGFFWWYFVHDCVPKSKPLWSEFHRAVR